MSRWLPALLMMLVIFFVSAQSSADLPKFDWADQIIKKGGHMIGYALLAVSYWNVLHFKPERRWLAWCLAVLYALTDEFHQSFVAGRNASFWDVLIFDNLGALFGTWLRSRYKRQRSDPVRPIVEEVSAKG